MIPSSFSGFSWVEAEFRPKNGGPKSPPHSLPQLSFQHRKIEQTAQLDSSNNVCVCSFFSITCVVGNSVALLKQCIVIIAGWQRGPRTSRLTSKSPERARASLCSQIAYGAHWFVSQQDRLQNLWGPPSAKWKCRSLLIFVQKSLRMSRWWQQSIKSSMKPCVTAQVTYPWSHPWILENFWLPCLPIF